MYCGMSVGSLLLEGYSWSGGESPSFPGAALGGGVSPHRPVDPDGLDGQEAGQGHGCSLLTFAAVLSRGDVVAYTSGSVPAHTSSITPSLS